MRSKTISLHLIDGEASGRWECRYEGRTLVAFKVPRNQYKNCTDLEELKKPAVYLLLGYDEGHNEKAVYIGETDDAFVRLGQHDGNKDFWNEVIIFNCIDDSLNKAYVKYLEGRLYQLAKEADRYFVMNGSVPAQTKLNKYKKDTLDDYVEIIRLLTSILGHKVFEKLVKEENLDSNNSIDEYTIEKPNCKATMIRTEEGYVVLKGSKIHMPDAQSAPSGMKQEREKLISDGIIIENIFQKDWLFRSPSRAASIVTGYSSSGPKEWKNEYGVELGEILASENNV